MNSAAFDVLIKISESYRPQIPSERSSEERSWERDQKRWRRREKWRVSGREEEFVRSSHDGKFSIARKELRTREGEKVRERDYERERREKGRKEERDNSRGSKRGRLFLPPLLATEFPSRERERARGRERNYGREVLRERKKLRETKKREKGRERRGIVRGINSGKRERTWERGKVIERGREKKEEEEEKWR